MKKSEFMKIPILFLGIAGILFIIFANPFNLFAKETETFVKKVTNNDILVYTQKYNSLIGEIRQKLHEKNLGFVLDYAILPDENVELIIKLSDEEIKKNTKIEIQQIVTKIIEQNDFDPNLFQINITSYYETTKDKNPSSVRLSYNDLMGYILESMLKEEYNTFSVTHKFTSKSIEITINLPVNENKNKEIQQIALNVIEQNNFNPTLFQINVTNNIITD